MAVALLGRQSRVLVVNEAVSRLSPDFFLCLKNSRHIYRFMRSVQFRCHNRLCAFTRYNRVRSRQSARFPTLVVLVLVALLAHNRSSIRQTEITTSCRMPLCASSSVPCRARYCAFGRRTTPSGGDPFSLQLSLLRGRCDFLSYLSPHTQLVGNLFGGVTVSEERNSLLHSRFQRCLEVHRAIRLMSSTPTLHHRSSGRCRSPTCSAPQRACQYAARRC